MVTAADRLALQLARQRRLRPKPLFGLGRPLDGLAGAPAGTAQYPHLLDLSSTTNGLGHNLFLRPPWHVAGVDYYVGIPSGTVLRAPTTISNPNINVDSVGKVVTINGANITLDSYDFSGWCVLSNAANFTVQNSKFAASGATALNGGGTLLQGSSGSLNITAQYCEFDGGGNGSWAVEMFWNVNSILYCYLHDAPNDFITYGIPMVIKFCLLENAGCTPASHADLFQIGGGPAAWNNTVQFCTGYMGSPRTNSSWGTQGYMFEPQDSSATTIGVCANNTHVTTVAGGGNQNFFTGVREAVAGTTNVIQPGITIHDNYVDPTGMGAFCAGLNSNPVGLVTFKNNINMLDGSLMVPNDSH